MYVTPKAPQESGTEALSFLVNINVAIHFQRARTFQNQIWLYSFSILKGTFLLIRHGFWPFHYELFAGGQSKSSLLQTLKHVFLFKATNGHTDSSGITWILKVKHVSKCL